MFEWDINFSALSPTRKVDRAKVAKHLCALAERHGFTSTWCEQQGMGASITLEHECGARCSILLDRDRRCAHSVVAAWHTRPGSDWTYPERFGDVNPHHGRKASKVYPWAVLDAHVNRDCRKVALAAAPAAGPGSTDLRGTCEAVGIHARHKSA